MRSGVQAQAAVWPTFAYNALHTSLSPFSGPVGPKVQGKWQVWLTQCCSHSFFRQLKRGVHFCQQSAARPCWWMDSSCLESCWVLSAFLGVGVAVHACGCSACVLRAQMHHAPCVCLCWYATNGTHTVLFELFGGARGTAGTLVPSATSTSTQCHARPTPCPLTHPGPW